MVNNSIVSQGGNSIIWQSLSLVACITLIAFVIIIFFPRKKKKHSHTSTTNNSNEKKSHEKTNNKNWWNYYRSSDKEVLEYYDLYFYWKPLKSWVSCEFYILSEKSKYMWFRSGEVGDIGFNKNSSLKKIFDIWIKEYYETGSISLKNFVGEVSETYLKCITSDVFIKECYMNGDKIKREFKYFEKVHGYSGKNDSDSSNNQHRNIDEKKKQVILAMKFFGFNKVPTFAEIKTSYKKQAMLYHPDRPSGSIVKMQKINEQYDILKKYFETQ